MIEEACTLVEAAARVLEPTKAELGQAAGDVCSRLKAEVHAALRLRRDKACGPPARACRARGGPLEGFSTRNLMPALSATPPISPCSASISRTRCALPSLAIAGLQDISPMVAVLCVTSAVRAPMRGRERPPRAPARTPPTMNVIGVWALTCSVWRRSRIDEHYRFSDQSSKVASNPPPQIFVIRSHDLCRWMIDAKRLSKNRQGALAERLCLTKAILTVI